MIHTKKRKKQITRCANCGEVITIDQLGTVENLCEDCIRTAEYHAAARSSIASLAMVYEEINSRFGF